MTTHTNKQKLLTVAVASLMGMSGQALAQDLSIEEVTVTGIRSSLTDAADIKREAQGVVDAISATDIGKMPDTNLAESLQRITGVSIDRQNGEGSRVTVRGFGPDFNVITLNGRQMPAANIDDTRASRSRSFDFSQLAAESVSGVQVYKSGRANLATGGIGSVINISTTRPLELKEGAASVTARVNHDETNIEGDDYTPEFSGIYSGTFADGTIGVAVSGSYAERHSGYAQGGTTSGWYTIPGGQGDWGSIAADDPNWANAPQEGEVYSVPRNILYSFGQVQRERSNAQFTLQWAPNDSITATLDYTYSELDIEEQRHEMSAWFNGNPTGGTFTTGAVKAPVIYGDSSGADVGFGAGEWGRNNEMNSIGLNIEWTPSDNLTLALDYHDSDAENGAKDSRGSNNIVTGVQFNRQGNRVDYSQDLPVLTLDLSTPFNPADMLSSGTSFRNSYMKSEIEQTQLSGTYEFDDSPIQSIDFGLSLTENKNRSAYSNAQRDTWGGYGTAADYDDDIYTAYSLSSMFDDLSGSGNPALESTYYQADFDGIIAAISGIASAAGETISPCGTVLCANPNFDTDRELKETQTAYYAQVNLAWDEISMPISLAIGVRFEDTDIDSASFVPQYSHIAWTGDNEFTAVSTGGGFSTAEGSYNHVLPNIDFSIDVSEDVKLRASSSTTLTRPNFEDLQGGKTINNPVRFNGGTGASGNPDLEPFESQNLDFSGEWYYDEGSYLSVGYYRKEVENFIGNTTISEATFNLAHPAQGDRYAAAVAANGGNTDPAVIRPFMEALYGTPVIGDASQNDPAAIFALVTPANANDASIDGWEVALQHMFGESGFGTILNYTTVDGDLAYDNANTNKGEGIENQFALLGLSDSANIVAFYEKNGLQARIAYNWRDSFLTETLDGNAERNPVYTDEYSQIDITASYEIPQVEGLTIMFDGINITGENLRTFGRTEEMVINAADLGARYSVGVRYQF